MRELLASALVAVVVTAILFSSFPPSAAAQPAALQKISSAGVLKVCYITYPPFVIREPNTGKLSGEMIDAIEYVAKEAGWKVEYVESTWGTFIAALQAKQCDVTTTGLFSRIERAKTVAFTRPIVYIGNSALVRKGEKRFATITDFNSRGVKIAVIQGEVGHLYAQKELGNADLIVLLGGDISLALAQVSAGKADAAFTDGWTIEQYAKEHPETVDFLSINPAASYGINPVSWAVRHEDADLLNFFNTALYDLEAEGKFLEFEKKYDAHWLRQEFVLQKS